MVTGAASRVGRRVCTLLTEHDPDAAIVAVDRRRPARLPAGVEVRQVDLATADLADLLVGADVLVHLASLVKADVLDASDTAADLTLVHRLLAASAAVDHLVLLSSAMVYGAWPTNPVPLTESAPVRPNQEYAFAVHKAELERLACAWRRGRSDRRLTILRPAVTVGENRPGGLARVLRDAAVVSTAEGDPPLQFLHADDLASAIARAVWSGVDEVLNVAPDTWLSADEFRALAGPRPTIRVPARVAQSLLGLRRRLGLGVSPPGLVAYTTYPWVVANDRLRALGWTPEYTNAEAYVASHAPGPLDRLTSRRRQTIALGVAGGAIVAAVAVAVALVIRLRRRRR